MGAPRLSRLRRVRGLGLVLPGVTLSVVKYSGQYLEEVSRAFRLFPQYRFLDFAMSVGWP